MVCFLERQVKLRTSLETEFRIMESPVLVQTENEPARRGDGFEDVELRDMPRVRSFA